MSVGVSNTQLLDLLATTLPLLPKGEFEIALQYQKHHILNRMFKNKRKKVESGESIKWNLQLQQSGAAQQTRLFQRSAINVTNTQKQAQVQWTQGQTFFAVETREVRRNRSPAGFVNLVESREKDALISFADLIERLGWWSPNSSSDDLNPLGVMYWASKLIPIGGISYESAIDIDQTFAGRRVIYGAPGTVATAGNSTVTNKAGLSPTLTANARLRNYAYTYTGVNADLVKRTRRAIHATNFEGPMLPSELREGRASMFALFMGLDELVEMEDMAQHQNDNVGADLDKFHGVTVLNRIPMYHASVLDDDVDDPIVGIDMNGFEPYVEEGGWLNRHEPMVDVEMHNTVVTWIDSSYQFVMKLPRETVFVGHKVLSA